MLSPRARYSSLVITEAFEEELRKMQDVLHGTPALSDLEFSPQTVLRLLLAQYGGSCRAVLPLNSKEQLGSRAAVDDLFKSSFGETLPI